MKKLFIYTLGALALVACNQQKKAETTDITTTDDTTDSISAAAGHFDVRNFDGFKLHIYLTEDQMGDASFIIEGTDSIVTLEQPLFKVNAAEFDKHLASIGKPVAKRIADFHLGNTGDNPIVMPQGMPEVVKGPGYSGMMSHFAEVYGDAIEPLPTGETEEVAFNSTVTFAGIPFTFYKGAENDFPAANILIGKDAVYMHWAPAKAHINKMFAGNLNDVNARTAELEQMLSTGATLFIGGHGNPGTADDVKFMIQYLTKIKELKNSNPDSSAFATALIKAYPNLQGEDGVKALAESFYAEN